MPLSVNYAEICKKYGAICSANYAGICTNMQIRNMHNKLEYAEIYKTKICTYIKTYHMHKYA